MSCKHVAKQTNSQRNQAQKCRKCFDEPQQQLERKHNSFGRKAFDIAPNPFEFATNADKITKRAGCHRNCDAHSACTWLSAWNQAHKIVEQDEEKDACQEGEMRLPGIAQYALAHVVADKINGKFNEINKAAMRNKTLGLALLERKNNRNINSYGCLLYTSTLPTILLV